MVALSHYCCRTTLQCHCHVSHVLPVLPARQLYCEQVLFLAASVCLCVCVCLSVCASVHTKSRKVLVRN